MEQVEQNVMETGEDPNITFHHNMFHNIKEFYQKQLYCDVTLFGKQDANSNDTQILKGLFFEKFHIHVNILIERKRLLQMKWKVFREKSEMKCKVLCQIIGHGW